MITTVKKIMYLNAQIQNVCVMQALYQIICQSGNCLLIRILAANVEDTERSEKMIGKYINQFMADNELSVGEEFSIKNLDGQKVVVSSADRYKIVDVDGGILKAVVDVNKEPPNTLLEVILMDLLRENYFIEKKPFSPAVGERYYFVDPLGCAVDRIFVASAEDFLLYKYIGVYKTEQAATKNVPRCLKLWEEVKRK